MKAYIEHGWPEGFWHSGLLRNDLINAGYQIADSPTEANVIIAHSSGCYTLPKKLKSNLILLIGLPNWPEKPLIKCTFEKVSLETKNWYWIQKTLWHVYYALFQPLRFYNVYKNYKGKNLLDLKGNKVVLVHNLKDTYMNESASRKLAKHKNWTYKNLEGQHDDIWQNTGPYIDLIQEYTV